ncbi:MAG: toll/interleukin-1 receptor domain-containing protein [Bacteroidia bacterium]
MEENYIVLLRLNNRRGNRANQLLVDVAMADILRLSVAYLNGSRSWHHDGRSHSFLAYTPEIHLLNRERFDAVVAKMVGAKTWASIKEKPFKIILSELMESYYGFDEDLLKQAADNVSNRFILGAHRSKKYGPETARYIASLKEEKESNSSPKAGVTKRVPKGKAPVSPEIVEVANKKRIFISHASKDQDLATHFVKYYLRDGLEIPMDQVFYTSHPATTIDVGDNFRDRIKQAIKDAGLVILLISENFKQSQYCIAEMGAAWVLDKIMIPICIPPFDRVGSGQLLGPLQYIDVNNKHGMTALRDQLVKKYGVGKIPENSVHFTEALDDFMRKAENKIAEIEAGKS